MSLTLDTKYLENIVKPHEWDGLESAVLSAHNSIHNQSGLGSDFLGWVDLPSNVDKTELSRINDAAKNIRTNCEVFLVVGIGGSYLGARAAIEFLRGPLYNATKEKGTPDIYFVGNSLSPSYLQDILTICKGKDVCINVISKSGTTTEPALAFRVLRQMLLDQYGEEGSAKRIFCTTDANKGTLKDLSDQCGYETFVIPDDVGGRFSVLTPVGLLPIAVAGCDVLALLAGAEKAQRAYNQPRLKENPCYQYAALRNMMRNKGKAIEVFVSYEPSLALMGEWFKQLYGESEGKDQKGLFPASMIFSTDLHSLGQFVQDGSRNLFETVLRIEKPAQNLSVAKDPENFDGLNFLCDLTMDEINHKAMQGTVLAHVEGGAPNLILTIPARDEDSLGQLFYFFEKACAISGYLLGVNPFDQPGVEQYKVNMFALLGKPGFEDHRKELEAKL